MGPARAGWFVAGAALAAPLLLACGRLSYAVVDAEARDASRDRGATEDAREDVVGDDASGDADADGGCAPEPELCDGVDNDCDGVVDDGTDAQRCPAGGSCLEGRCRGAYEWDRVFGGAYDEKPASVAVAPDGRIVVAGTFTSPVDFGGGVRDPEAYRDMVVLALDADGRYAWDVTAGAADGSVLPSALAVDGSGRVYVTGAFQGVVDFGGGPVAGGTPGFAGFLVAYDRDGAFRWQRVFVSTTQCVGWSVTASDSAVVAAASFRGDVSFGGTLQSSPVTATCVVRYDTGGGFGWERCWGDDAKPSLALGPEGDVLVGGRFYDADFGGGARSAAGVLTDAFVVAFSGAGEYRWDRVFGSPAGGQEHVGGVVPTGDGGLLAVGQFWSPLDLGGGAHTPASDDVFVVALDAEGTYLHDRALGGPGIDGLLGAAPRSGGGVCLALATSGRLGLDGRVRGESTGLYGAVLALAADGTPVWERAWPDSRPAPALAVAPVPGGGIVVVGDYYGAPRDLGGGFRPNAGDADLFVLRLTD